MYPADALLPNVSNVNFSPGQIVPNSVQVKLGSTGADLGRIRIYNFAGQTHVIVQATFDDKNTAYAGDTLVFLRATLWVGAPGASTGFPTI